MPPITKNICFPLNPHCRRSDFGGEGMGSTEGDDDAGAMRGTGSAGSAGVAGVGGGFSEGDGGDRDAGAMSSAGISDRARVAVVSGRGAMAGVFLR